MFNNSIPEKDICTSIKSKLLISFNYDGKSVLVAPLCFGKINDGKYLRCIHVDGYSKSKIDGTSDSNFRLYKLENIKNTKPQLQDFDINSTREYITKKFDFVIQALDL